MLTQSEDIIKDFINKILEEKGVLSMDKEVVDQMRSDLTDRLETRINASVLENIPKDKLEEFEALLDKDDDSEIQNFISKNVPDLDALIASTMISFRNIYFGVAA
ncbi:MAG: hypothetical protein KBF62_00330 [Candidatus Pacebacteria bacterium]|nr:hypothetical protein [Candidatus Paceibacterota bacterium]MBP9058074.1 hypothetical protein [Candidatus Paceibacterota bacterium]MBP9769968.1 hypothetical protein [Candidatus Paceibacterota bacterium]